MELSASAQTGRPRRIGVGAITRRRGQMFRVLLESFAAMRVPQGCELVFLLVENDDRLSIAEIVEDYRERLPGPSLAEVEATPGIPMARNRVLDMALREGCDFLTFVDDDEAVTADWLVRMTDAVEARGLDLAGGPLEIVPADDADGFWTAPVLEHFRRRAERRNAKRAAAVADGSDGAFDVYTNNWCARLSTVRATGVRFDERLQFTGGSDTRFSKDFRAAGARIGWVPDAIVQDRLPSRRLTPGYVFERSRDQTKNGVEIHDKSLGSNLAQVVMRGLEGIVLLVASPVLGKRAVVRAFHKAGIAAGRISASFGSRSSHYAQDLAARHSDRA